MRILGNIVEGVSDDPTNGLVGFSVKSSWACQVLDEYKIDSYTVVGKTIVRDVTMMVDDTVLQTSPNYFNIARPVELQADLEIIN